MKAKKISRAERFTIIALVVIVLLGAFFRFYQLGSSGYGNDYYAAAVKSMLTSWHNFFFVAFEPGGSVSVDKPPLGFWIEALSALIFGVNGFALALPNALAGVFSILLVFYLVNKQFGRIPGLIAALALACMPITIVTERNNTIDGMLVFTLLLATWAFMKAVEKEKIGWLFLGAVIMGLAFNIKMLQAYMVLPALYLLYFLGSRQKWWKRLVNLGLAAAIMLVISLSWAVIVDATPTSERPYVGSSTDNSVIELIIGHNGLERLTRGVSLFGNSGGGMRGGGGPTGGSVGGRMSSGNNPGIPSQISDQPNEDVKENTISPSGEQQESGGFPQGGPGMPGGGPGDFQPGNGQEIPEGGPEGTGETAPGGSGMGRNPPSQQPGGGMPGQQGGPMGGGMNLQSRDGFLRLFTGENAAQASWLLPLAMIGIVFFFALIKPLKIDKKQWLGMVFWAGWLIPCFLYFTYTSGLWHTYYLIMLGPAIAALTGILYWTLDQLRKRSGLWSKGLLTAVSLFTAAFEVYAISSYQTYVRPFAVVIAVYWLVAILLYWVRPREWSLLLVILVLMFGPLLWSGLSVMNSNTNTNLPVAEPGTRFGSPVQSDNTQPDSGQQELIDYLQANTTGNEYLLAAISSREASSFILATGRPVLTFGGFSGSDDIIDVEGLKEMVDNGKLRYVLDSGDLRDKTDIYTWITENCSVVQYSDSQNPAQNTTGGGRGNPGGSNYTLYDCSGTN